MCGEKIHLFETSAQFGFAAFEGDGHVSRGVLWGLKSLLAPSDCGSAAARRDPAFLIEVRILSRVHIGFELQGDEFLDSGDAKQQRNDALAVSP